MVFVPSLSERGQPALERTGLPRLSASECRALLEGASSGHLALSQGALPMVLPVSCRVNGDSLLVRAAQAVLGAPSQPGIVAFAASGNSPDQAWRWEVVVQGRAEMVDPALGRDQLADFVQPPDLPLLVGDLTTVLRISIELVTGWQFGAPAPAVPTIEEQL